MTRNEEYQALLQELETTPAALDGAVERALRRRKRDRRLRLFGVPAGSLAACFAAFVLLVNLFPPFARACGSVPVLRELAQAVAWSPSLSAAVENDYVQPIGQSQTVNGVTATVDLDSKTAIVTGEVSDDAIRAAITEAGYEVTSIQ